MKVFFQIILSFGVLILLGCSSFSKNQESRNPSQDNSFEALCSTKMDLNFTKLTISSLFHRDHPDLAKKLKLVYGVQLRMKDGSIVSTDVPGFQSPNAPYMEMSGINFPTDNGIPYVEYKVTTRMDWLPLNSNNNFPYLEGQWAKTEMAGLCLDFNPPVSLSIQIVGDLSSKGISRVSRVQYNYEISGKKIQYVVPFAGNLASSEILIPPPGLTLTYQLTWIQNGQVVKGTPKTIGLQSSQSAVLISLTEADFQ